MVICWLRSETMAMIGAPAMRDSTDATARSLRPLAAPALSPITITAAQLAMARRAGCNQVGLCLGLRKQEVIRVGSDRLCRPTRELIAPYSLRYALQSTQQSRAMTVTKGSTM